MATTINNKEHWWTATKGLLGHNKRVDGKELQEDFLKYIYERGKEMTRQQVDEAAKDLGTNREGMANIVGALALAGELAANDTLAHTEKGCMHALRLIRAHRIYEQYLAEHSGYAPAEWHERPVCIGQDYARGTWRRTEGVGFLSGVGARFRLGLDALERLKDDRPVRGMGLDDLHEESVASFRSAVVRRRPEWSELPLEAFLARAQVLSGGAVTQAGNLMLGRRATRVRAEVRRGNAESEALEVRNLWKAYSDLMPRLTRSLSPACAAAFRECFVNALLHADYDGGDVTVLLRGGPASARFKNPGLMRTQHRGESACRNFRLMKVFQLLGAARGDGRGLSLIRRYQPDFALQQDALELTTTAVLNLEPMAALQGTPPAARPSAQRRKEAAQRPSQPDGQRSQREALSQEAAPAEAEPTPFLLAPTAPAEAPASVEEAVASRAVEESAPSGSVENAPTGHAGKVPTGQGVEAERAAEDAPAASEPRRQTSFGSAADELERAIAEMRGRP